jgi:ApeA N-terminal domain 1
MDFNPLFGTFKVNDKEISGKLLSSDDVISAYLFSADFFYVNEDDQRALFGHTDDNQLISLLYSVVKSNGGTKTHLKSGRSLRSAVLCPQYVITGDSHFDPDTHLISELEIFHPKFEHIYHDPSRLLEVVKADEAIKVLEENGLIEKDEREIGWRSSVCVLKDRGVLASFMTDIGEIIVDSTLCFPSFSSYEQRLLNRAVLRIRFDTPQTLANAVSRLQILKGLAELSVGHEILIDEIAFRVSGQQEDDGPLRLQFCDLKFGSRRAEKDRWLDSVDWRSALISNFQSEEEFARVLTSWCNASAQVTEARHRLLEGIRQGSFMSIDRFVGACNAFDLLPDECYASIPSALPNLVSLKAEIKCLVRKADIPDETRERVLNTVGRIASKTLRDKVLERLKIISQHSVNILPRAEIGVAHAIMLRNRYVHGSDTKLSQAENGQFFIFFGHLVEAIFVFSDLIECGLDLKEKLKNVQGHPLFWFNHGFDARMVELEKVIEGR